MAKRHQADFNPYQEFFMRAFSDDFLQQFASGFIATTRAHFSAPPQLSRSGAFELQYGTALRLTPQEAAVLRVTTGRIWATLSGQTGDHVLCAGDALAVTAGDVLVIESWPARGAAGAGHSYFTWALAQ